MITVNMEKVANRLSFEVFESGKPAGALNLFEEELLAQSESVVDFVCKKLRESGVSAGTDEELRGSLLHSVGARLAPVSAEINKVRRRGVSLLDIQNWFTYHAPNQKVIPLYNRLREAARDFAQAIYFNTPPCADQTAAIRRLRESVMTANAAIACGDEDQILALRADRETEDLQEAVVRLAFKDADGAVHTRRWTLKDASISQSRDVIPKHDRGGEVKAFEKAPGSARLVIGGKVVEAE